MTKICQKCKEEGEDRRTLWMACLYEMNELAIPFCEESLFTNDYPRCDGRKFYTLRVCKDCRASWMQAIKDWFNEPIVKEESCGSGIYIRENGINKEITEEEWTRRCPNVQPANNSSNTKPFKELKEKLEKKHGINLDDEDDEEIKNLKLNLPK